MLVAIGSDGLTLTLVCHGCGGDFRWTCTALGQDVPKWCRKGCQIRAAAWRRQVLDDDARPDDPDAWKLRCRGCEIWFTWTPPTEGRCDAPQFHSHNCRARNKRRVLTEAVELRRAEQTTQAIAAAVGAAQRRAVERGQVPDDGAAEPRVVPAEVRCPLSGKVAALTTTEAEELRRSAERRTGHGNPVRYYQCSSGYWHWTRVDADLDGWRARRTDDAHR